MSTRGGVIVKGVVLGAAVAAAAGLVGTAEAQPSRQVVFVDPPVGVGVFVVGRPAPVVLPPRVAYHAPRVVRYRPGMSLRQLDVYLARIEHEYDVYRKMHPHEARRLGWSVPELRHYVRWLRDERRWLRDERVRLTRGYRTLRLVP
jgi:hypothetical protein